jgi:phospholipid-binding lipoprotein MlaA
MIREDAPRCSDRPLREILLHTATAGTMALAAAQALAQDADHRDTTFERNLAEADDPNDPFEPVNRAIYGFNDVVDGLVLKPVSTAYGTLPSPVRTGVRNFLDNLRAPVVFVNDVASGDRERAGVTLGRFMINTFMGGAGLFDVAAAFGYPKHTDDFGLTLGRYGIGEGPYLVLPILGPSSPRDAFGLAIDAFLFDPVFYLAPLDVRLGRTAVDGVDTRERLDPAITDVKKNSLDPYATFRSVYRQRRAAQLQRGTPVTDETYESIFNEPDEPDTPVE